MSSRLHTKKTGQSSTVPISGQNSHRSENHDLGKGGSNHQTISTIMVGSTKQILRKSELFMNQLTSPLKRKTSLAKVETFTRSSNTSNLFQKSSRKRSSAMHKSYKTIVDDPVPTPTKVATTSKGESSLKSSKKLKGPFITMVNKDEINLNKQPRSGRNRDQDISKSYQTDTSSRNRLAKQDARNDKSRSTSKIRDDDKLHGIAHVTLTNALPRPGLISQTLIEPALQNKGRHHVQPRQAKSNFLSSPVKRNFNAIHQNSNQGEETRRHGNTSMSGTRLEGSQQTSQQQSVGSKLFAAFSQRMVDELNQSKNQACLEGPQSQHVHRRQNSLEVLEMLHQTQKQHPVKQQSKSPLKKTTQILYHQKFFNKMQSSVKNSPGDKPAKSPEKRPPVKVLSTQIVDRKPVSPSKQRRHVVQKTTPVNASLSCSIQRIKPEYVAQIQQASQVGKSQRNQDVSISPVKMGNAYTLQKKKQPQIILRNQRPSSKRMVEPIQKYSQPPLSQKRQVIEYKMPDISVFRPKPIISNFSMPSSSDSKEQMYKIKQAEIIKKIQSNMQRSEQISSGTYQYKISSKVDSPQKQPSPPKIVPKVIETGADDSISCSSDKIKPSVQRQEPHANKSSYVDSAREVYAPQDLIPNNQQSEPNIKQSSLHEVDLSNNSIFDIGEPQQDFSDESIHNVQELKYDKEQGSFPIAPADFLSLHQDVLDPYEQEELATQKDSVYYAADVPSRTERPGYKLVDWEDEENYYALKEGDQIAYRYEVTKLLGKGSFAQVVAAIDHKLGSNVALKINRNSKLDHEFADNELALLSYLMNQDQKDEYNIVRMLDHISFREHQCFVFELLNTDLFEHLKENNFMGFPVSQIQKYAYQLLQALVFLEERQVIHCDLKPENILLVDKTCQKLKVVDFGSGCINGKQVYTYVQSRFYRSPEVIMRVPYSEKVDMWSLGCILAELYTGEPLFAGGNEQEQLELIMEVKGIPSESLIDRSRKRDHYFDTDYSPFLIEDPESDAGVLRIPLSRPIETAVPSTDQFYLDFISKCLELDPEERFSASEAMEHPWIQQYLTKRKSRKTRKYFKATTEKQTFNYAQVNLDTGHPQAPSPSFDGGKIQQEPNVFANTVKQFKRLSSPQILAEMNIEKQHSLENQSTFVQSSEVQEPQILVNTSPTKNYFRQV